MRTALAVVVFLAASAAGVVVSAQPAVGGLAGVVMDPFGDPLSGVEVSAESVSGYREVRETDSAGVFRFVSLVAGRYRVVAAVTDFEPEERPVDVAPGVSLVLDEPFVLLPTAPAGLTVRVVDPQGLALPGVVVQAVGPRGVLTEGVAGADGVFHLPSVRPGRWSVEAALPGFAPGDGAVEAAFGVDAVVTLMLALDYSVAEDVVVLGTSRPPGRRTEVRMVDSPVTTSVVSSEALATAPSANVGDVLRAVPGLNVIQLSARDVQVTSRHSAGVLANSQLVLMDGRSVYLDFFGMVLWDSLPVGTGDIEQIEVVRGPASATWGPNAMTGAVHVITRAPRDAVGTTLTMSGGWIDRDAGSTAGHGAGTLFGTNATFSRAPSDRLAYRVSAGYFQSDAFPRPTGRIPVARHPRAGLDVGGAAYPLDGPGPLGQAFVNRGTAQPKFDVRVDQELSGGGELTYSGGVGATDGVLHSGLGPFDVERGSYLGYGKVGYTQGDFRLQAFTNIVDGDAFNLLLGDAQSPGRPLHLGFASRTFDVDAGHSTTFGGRHVVHYGGNVRRNTFDISVAPDAAGRLEFGGYVEDQVFFDRFRLVLGGRVDKFGAVAAPFFSPRVSFMLKPGVDHSLTLSYNRAFRSPSVVENFLQLDFLQPVDLSELAAFRPYLNFLLPAGLPPAAVPDALADLERQLDQTVSQPFPLRVGVVGSDLPLGSEPRAGLDAESLTAYEASYAGTFSGRTTLGGSVYVNRRDGGIHGLDLPPADHPYTADDPPSGWVLPPQALTFMALVGAYLPRVAQTFVNLGPTRSLGAELWLDQRLSSSASLSASYSWQGEPVILASESPFPPAELGLPPAHRLAAGATLDGPRFLGSASVNTATRAFWTDVLTSEFHGYSEGYTTVNGSFGVKWNQGEVTTLVKVTNLFNRSIQQHVFGDILQRTVVGEVRFSL